jgi:rubrerythrin
MEPTIFKCMKCGWQGAADKLDWDTVETCMGNDKMEVCPICGSMEVFTLPKRS